MLPVRRLSILPINWKKQLNFVRASLCWIKENSSLKTAWSIFWSNMDKRVWKDFSWNSPVNNSGTDMQILKATIIKDLKILLRDRVGLFMMFFMPVLLVIVITSVQNSTFELVNNNKISLIIENKDKGLSGAQLIEGIGKMGLFKIQLSDTTVQESEIAAYMHSKNALVALVIPSTFTVNIQSKAENIASRALKDEDSVNIKTGQQNTLPDNMIMYYHPVMQDNFRRSVVGALETAVQVIQGEAIVKQLYEAVNQKEIPPELEKQIIFGHAAVT